MLEFFKANFHYIFMILFLISEIIGETTRIKSNSIFGVIRNFLRGEAQKSKPQVDKLLSENQ